jgi:hypothetical protein
VDGGVRFAGTAGSWRAGVEVGFTPPATPTRDGVEVTADVAARGTWTLEARVVLRPEGAASPAGGGRARLARPRADLAAVGRRPGRAADAGRRRPAAGRRAALVHGRLRPGHVLTCLLTLALGQDPARAALRALARWQSTVDDPARDAEPGKIPHEVRAGKLAALGTGLPYYGSVDATPLYVLLAVETWRWTGDDELARDPGGLPDQLLAAGLGVGGADRRARRRPRAPPGPRGAPAHRRRHRAGRPRPHLRGVPALAGRWDVTARAGTVAVEPAAGYSIG